MDTDVDARRDPGQEVSPWPSLSAQAAGLIALAWTIAIAAVAVVGHPTPLYGVETDLVGEYLPAAKELLSGLIDPSHYAYKGPGYPLLVALLSVPFGGDVLLAAKLLSPIAAGLTAWLTFLIARRAAGAAIATFAFLAMLVSPVLVQFAIESGTDTPALALMLASTLVVLRDGDARSLVASGLLAAFAVLSRGNAVFLVPCAVVVLLARRRPWTAFTCYAAGFAVPMAVWQWVAAQHGGLPADRNYLNVAWELYGRGARWGEFEARVGLRFHSMWDVFAFDPLRALVRVIANLFAHRLRDLQEMVTIAPGLLAVTGLFLLARMRSARAWLFHGFACALVLAPIFYGARFGLYLLPLYLAGAGATLAWMAKLLVQVPSGSRLGRIMPHAVASIAAGMLLTLGWTAFERSRRSLADAPHEARVAGEMLARLGAANTKIAARKPHVAYFANMQFVPMPTDQPLSQLGSWAAAHGTPYLFYSGIEQLAQPAFTLLADSGLALPGIEQILWRQRSPGKFFAVYRLSPSPVDSTAFALARRMALLRYDSRHRDSPEGQLFVAAELLNINEPNEARVRLDRLVQAGVRDQAVERYRAAALLALGDLEGAATASQEAMKLMAPSAAMWAQLGRIRMKQGRSKEGLVCFEKAVEIEPATLEFLILLGRAQALVVSLETAAQTFERCLTIAPMDSEARQRAITVWRTMGNERRARELEGTPPSPSPRGAANATTRPPVDVSVR